MGRRVWLAVVTSAFLMLLPTAARAQSSIAGVVRDTSGAVLPGVTVEAASPALIEKTRSVVTDASGQYKIVDLRPGVYTVTFTLEGFAPIKREGIELTANFTASINAELKVGSLAETITVSGSAPLVDVQTTQQREVLTRAVLDALPTGRNYQTIGATLPGVSMGRFDVGGSTAMQQSTVISAGSQGVDMAMLVDGMNIMSSLSNGSVPAVYHNDGAYQEYVYQVSGANAEFSSGGVTINMIPKEGSNTVKADGVALFTNSNFQSANVDDTQRSQGVSLPAKIDKTWDYDANVGFPVLKDRLWWFTSIRFWGYNNFAPNAVNADGSQGVDDNDLRAWTNRATAQINQKNKLTVMYDYLPKYRGHRNIELGTFDPEATVVQRTPRSFNTQAKWTSTITNKLLLEAGYSENYYDYTLHYQPSVQNGSQLAPYGTISHFDIITGRTSNAATYDFEDAFPFYNLSGISSYVTGSHAIRAGIQYGHAWINSWRQSNGDMVQRYASGVPNSVQRWNTPITPGARSNLDYLVGMFIQDSWTLKRLTLNPGIRFEAIRGSVPAQTAPAGRFVPARSFAAIDNLPNWKNVVPRLGAAYDLFGNGKTAVKGSVGRYNEQQATGFAAKYNPLQLGSDIVTWTDLNGDNIAEDNELGAANNATLGLRRNINPDPSVKRPYQLLYNVGVQHQLLQKVSVSVNYFHREYKDLTYTTNLAVPLSAYDLVTIPDPRGNGQLPVYNLQKAYLGLVNELDTTSPNNWRHYNGVDFNLSARGGGGLTVAGGVSIGRTVSKMCDVEDPNQLRFCDQSQYSVPLAKTAKLTWSYPLPLKINFSGVFQTADGYNTAAPPTPLLSTINPDNHDRMYTYTLTKTTTQNGAVVLPTLTQSSLAIYLDPPGTNWMPRVTQLDLAFSKSAQFGRVRLTPQVDVFNLLNANPVLSVVTSYGARIGYPSTILSGRLVRFQLKVLM